MTWSYVGHKAHSPTARIRDWYCVPRISVHGFRTDNQTEAMIRYGHREHNLIHPGLTFVRYRVSFLSTVRFPFSLLSEKMLICCPVEPDRNLLITCSYPNEDGKHHLSSSGVPIHDDIFPYVVKIQIQKIFQICSFRKISLIYVEIQQCSITCFCVWSDGIQFHSSEG